MQNWQVKKSPVPHSNNHIYTLVDENGHYIADLCEFTKEQRDLIEAAPIVLEALKAYHSANIVHNDREAELYHLGAAAIAKTEGKSYEQ
jgi:hypothetical protein